VQGTLVSTLAPVSRVHSILVSIYTCVLYGTESNKKLHTSVVLTGEPRRISSCASRILKVLRFRFRV